MKGQKDSNSRKGYADFGNKKGAGRLKEAFDKAAGRKTQITLII